MRFTFKTSGPWLLGFLVLALAACAFHLAPTSATASEGDEKAKALATELLTKGAALYDTYNASAMAATYTDNSEIHLVLRDQSTGKYATQDSRGRTAIEKLYHDLFEGKSNTKSKNVVESAHFVGDDLLIIHGTFAPDVATNSKIPFVQVRVREGESWKIMSLQLFVVNE